MIVYAPVASHKFSFHPHLLCFFLIENVHSALDDTES